MVRFDACAKVFKVPKASVAHRLVVSGRVESLADHARLEYRGHHPMTRDEAIHFSQICLRTSAKRMRNVALKSFSELLRAYDLRRVLSEGAGAVPRWALGSEIAPGEDHRAHQAGGDELSLLCKGGRVVMRSAAKMPHPVNLPRSMRRGALPSREEDRSVGRGRITPRPLEVSQTNAVYPSSAARYAAPRCGKRSLETSWAAPWRSVAALGTATTWCARATSLRSHGSMTSWGGPSSCRAARRRSVVNPSPVAGLLECRPLW